MKDALHLLCHALRHFTLSLRFLSGFWHQTHLLPVAKRFNLKVFFLTEPKLILFEGLVVPCSVQQNQISNKNCLSTSFPWHSLLKKIIKMAVLLGYPGIVKLPPEGSTWVSAVGKNCLAAVYLRQRSSQCTDALQGLGDSQQSSCFLQKKNIRENALLWVFKGKMEVEWTVCVSKVRKVWWHQAKSVCSALGEDAGTWFICQRGSSLLRRCFPLSFSHTLRPQASRLPMKITAAHYLI